MAIYRDEGITDEAAIAAITEIRLLLISNEDKRAAMVGKGIGGVLGTFSGRARHSCEFQRKAARYSDLIPATVPI